MNAIEIKELSKTYKGKGKARVEALLALTLHIAAGEVFGFLGPNGAGKSTTIKLLTGQIRATSGTASIFGVPAELPTARQSVGYLPENPSFYGFMTGREYLRFVGSSFGMAPAAIADHSDRVLRLLQLDQAADRPISGYSKGMVQRLGLAQTLVHDPALYILDEPMSGLDPLGRALVKDIIRGLKAKGKAVFFSTHITSDVEAVCDRVGVIAGGVLRSVEHVQDILTAGLEGYAVQIVHPDGRAEERQVGKDQLKQTMGDILASGAGIERIEPRRQDLEAFFLQIVSGNKQ